MCSRVPFSQGVCWDSSWPPSDSSDIAAVSAVLPAWRSQQGLSPSLPLAAYGASSGGYFITVLAHTLRLSALVVHIASGVLPAFQKSIQGVGGYPPTLFVHMPKDRHTAAGVKHALAVLRKEGCEAEELMCQEKRITEGFFAQRIPGLKRKQSGELYNVLKKEGLIEEDGLMTKDGRQVSWREYVDKQVDGDKDSQLGDWQKYEDGIEEELNVAYAYHELSAEYAEEQMDWFEGVCRETDDNEKKEGRCKYSTKAMP